MKKLTRAEEEVMQIIWQLGPSTVADIRTYMAETSGQPKPPHSTISTIVRILEEKQFLSHKAYGRTYEYHPLIPKKQYSRQTLDKLVKDYFQGSPNELVSYLVREREVSAADLQELLKELDHPKE